MMPYAMDQSLTKLKDVFEIREKHILYLLIILATMQK